MPKILLEAKLKAAFPSQYRALNLRRCKQMDCTDSRVICKWFGLSAGTFLCLIICMAYRLQLHFTSNLALPREVGIYYIEALLGTLSCILPELIQVSWIIAAACGVVGSFESIRDVCVHMMIIWRAVYVFVCCIQKSADADTMGPMGHKGWLEHIIWGAVWITKDAEKIGNLGFI